jgi:hypothetical protein
MVQMLPGIGEAVFEHGRAGSRFRTGILIFPVATVAHNQTFFDFIFRMYRNNAFWRSFRHRRLRAYNAVARVVSDQTNLSIAPLNQTTRGQPPAFAIDPLLRCAWPIN